MNYVKKIFQYGDHTITLETGEIARQASASVVVTMGDTVVLVTCVVEKNAAEGRDFFPLTVDYIEKTYAAGKIPGGFLKREGGRPSEKEILTSRLIDRPLRPLFPWDFTNEIQIVATVLSQDPEIDADIPSLLGASAALMLTGVPFTGPVGAARVGYADGVFLLNPKISQFETSKLDLVVAGTDSAVLMVESEAKELSEDIMLSAVMFGHEQSKLAIKAISEFVKEAGRRVFEWQAKEFPSDIVAHIEQQAAHRIAEAYTIAIKQERHTRLDEIRQEITAQFASQEENDGKLSQSEIITIFGQIEEKTVRQRIIRKEPRIDGRDERTVRPIRIKLGFLPRVHGSALFTRGETQAMVVATLGTARDAQMIDALLTNESKENFMLHYNFPPYSVGELGRVGSPKRREIGHGRLAKRAIQAILPSDSEFPYVLRVVSEITESNGSSSMATVCGASLSLMEAGVPIKAPVAGIAMGLIKEQDQFVVLTDILGDEDHLGDMDFKVAGTSTGVTALQMDIKIDGITKEIMEIALEQARAARFHILGEMAKAIEIPRHDISQFAPRMIMMQISKEKIRDVIGKGGATIRGIIDETGVAIDISDEGLVQIAATDLQAGEEAKRRIEELTSEVEVGRVYEGTVAKLADFGAFVTILPGKDGLVHISQISSERVNNVADYLKEGQMIKVKVLEIDRQGRIKLSMKDVV